ncbi:hypothetical protein [Psychrobacillus sp. OK032]|nr:hypothetical protein [Psychrobacillus sp. OK032]
MIYFFRKNKVDIRNPLFGSMVERGNACEALQVALDVYEGKTADFSSK